MADRTAWEKRDGVDVLVVGAFRMIVRRDNSWTLIVHGQHTAEKQAKSRNAAKRAVLDAARDVLSQWSIALDVHASEVPDGR